MGKPTFVTVFALGLMLISGCASHSVYHDTGPVAGNCVADPQADACRKSYYQEHRAYDVAFVEFTERGNVFNSTYYEDVVSRIRQKAEREGILLVVFVHGWKNNADEQNGNLLNFKAKTLTALSDKAGGKQVIGLFVGWRGASIEFPGLQELTFWDRKEVAEEVGKGGITRLLLDLDKIDGETGDRNVMVVVGHSFGGAIVVSALTEVLSERVVNRTKGRGYARTIGDGVLVLNPAIEANQALPFVEAALNSAKDRPFQDEQYPLFISLSTTADSATHKLFPLGQSVGLLATWHQEDLHRDYYADARDGRPLALKEEHLDATTVGNFAPFLTHHLSLDQSQGAPKFRFVRCEDERALCEPEGFTSLDGQPMIQSVPENFPLYFIRTDASVMTGHNDIFNPVVEAFVYTVMDDVVRRSLLDKEQRVLYRSVLNDEAVFSEVSQQALPSR